MSMCACMHAQSCPTLCDPMDHGSPSSSVHRIFQARILEWVAISSSGNLPNTGIEPMSPALAGRFFTTEPPGKPLNWWTGNNLGYKSTTQQNWQLTVSWKIQVKTWHTFPSCFYRKQTPLHMKTADHKNTDPRPAKTRRVMMLETSLWCQPI